MKMKQTKLFLAALLAGAVMMLTPQKAWADSVTDDQLTAATEQISVGACYYIKAEYNSTTYYLTSTGTLTETKGSATAFQFTSGNTTAGYKTTAWFITSGTKKFTNPDCTESGKTLSLKGELKTSTSTRIWESQVIYYNGSKFAIRATNANVEPGEGWYGCNCFWYVTTDASSNVVAEYTSTGDDGRFVWELEEEDFTNVHSTYNTTAYNALEMGATYTITTTYNSTTYYLKSDGYLTSTEGEAGKFILLKSANNAYETYGIYISSGGLRFSNREKVGTDQDYVATNSDWNGTYRAQALYYKGGKFAVRSTNTSGTAYDCQYFWSVKDEDSDGVPTISYKNNDSNDPDFIWSFNKLNSNPVSFISGKLYTLKSKQGYYFKSPASYTTDQVTAGKLNITSSVDEAAQVHMIPTSLTNSFYLQDVRSGYYLVAAGGDWTISSTTPVAAYIQQSNDGGYWCLANGYKNTNERSWANPHTSGMKVGLWDYTDDNSKWTISEVVDATIANTIQPTNLYYIRSYRGLTNKYFQSAASNGFLGRTNSAESAGKYCFIPTETAGQYYIYDTVSKQFVVPENTSNDGGNWKLSTTTPTPVKVSFGDRPNKVGLVYLFQGTAEKGFANAYNGDTQSDGRYRVANYTASTTDDGANWYLERADLGTDAIVDISALTSNITTLATGAASSGMTLRYTGSVTNYGTLILPFEYTLPSGVDAYNELSMSGDAVQGTKINSGETVAANTPVILKGTNADYTVSGTAVAPASETITDGILTGTYASYTTVAGDYVLQKHTVDAVDTYAFYLVGDTKPTVKPFRAYMPASVGGSAKAFTFNLDGVETGVEMVQGEGFKVKDSRIYNLSGQRLSKAHKGLNIVNGIKYVVK